MARFAAEVNNWNPAGGGIDMTPAGNILISPDYCFPFKE